MPVDDASVGGGSVPAVSPLLALDGVTAGYKATTVLNGIDLAVPRGDIVAVLGPNGAGKTTLLRAISGLIVPTHGSVRFDGVEIAGWKPERIVSAGVSHAPEGRRMFPYLSTEANLRMGAYTRRDRRQVETEIDEMLDRFEVIGRRRSTPANLLSGGEQQLVCLLRAIIAKPKLLLLDEPSLGLAPTLINLIYDVISELAAERNLSLLVVEQNARHALDIATTAYVIVGGNVVYHGPASDLDAASVAEMYFTHGAHGSANPEASERA